MLNDDLRMFIKYYMNHDNQLVKESYSTDQICAMVTDDPSLIMYAAVYGANAAGKSNLINAVSFVIDTLRFGLRSDCVRFFCRNRKENRDRDSLFELQLEIDGRFYAYGFAARLASGRITHEWLYELKVNGEAKTVFERREGEEPVLGSRVKLTMEEKPRFETYASDFRENERDLFLSEMNRGKKRFFRKSVGQ